VEAAGIRSIAVTLRLERDEARRATTRALRRRSSSPGYKLFHTRHAGSIFPAQFGPGSIPKVSVSGSEGKDFASNESYQKVNPDWSI
jgi:hypothetical protein